MVKENLEFCLKKLGSSGAKSGFSSIDITLVAVTKGVLLSQIQEAIDLGLDNIGENKIQEALLKFDVVNTYARQKGVRLVWHMIGHLQTNKAKDAVRIFDLIQSVDSLRLAQEIDRQALKINKIQDVLLEIKTSEEATKYGFLPLEMETVMPQLDTLKNIKVKGLMTMAPPVDDAEKARPYFKKLKDLSDTVFVHGPWSMVHRPVLSMGMTNDFEVAVSEGATMVRIGRGLFGS